MVRVEPKCFSSSSAVYPSFKFPKVTWDFPTTLPVLIWLTKAQFWPCTVKLIVASLNSFFLQMLNAFNSWFPYCAGTSWFQQSWSVCRLSDWLTTEMQHSHSLYQRWKFYSCSWNSSFWGSQGRFFNFVWIGWEDFIPVCNLQSCSHHECQLQSNMSFHPKMGYWSLVWSWTVQ